MTPSGLSLCSCPLFPTFLCTQVQLKEYSFESRHRPAFSGEDIVNMFPVVKHLKATGTDGTVLVQHARMLIWQGEGHTHNWIFCTMCVYVYVV